MMTSDRMPTNIKHPANIGSIQCLLCLALPPCLWGVLHLNAEWQATSLLSQSVIVGACIAWSIIFIWNSARLKDYLSMQLRVSGWSGLGYVNWLYLGLTTMPVLAILLGMGGLVFSAMS